jgi:hypothetical protein
MTESLELGTRLAPSLNLSGWVPRWSPMRATEGRMEPPVIDWRASLGTSDRRADSERARDLRKTHWSEDFANHLGRSAAERDANSKLRVVAPSVAAQVISEAARRIGAFFR